MGGVWRSSMSWPNKERLASEQQQRRSMAIKGGLRYCPSGLRTGLSRRARHGWVIAKRMLANKTHYFIKSLRKLHARQNQF